jgi:hypothetical protein
MSLSAGPLFIEYRGGYSIEYRGESIEYRGESIEIGFRPKNQRAIF